MYIFECILLLHVAETAVVFLYLTFGIMQRLDKIRVRLGFKIILSVFPERHRLKYGVLQSRSVSN